MEILDKKDYDKCEMDGFKLNQKVLLRKSNKKSKILAIDTSGHDDYKFFVIDGEGDFLRKYIPGYRTKKSLDKKGIWCTKRELSPITDNDNESFAG